jgi:cell volume regulation protein A
VNIDGWLVIAAVLLLLGVIASKASSRLGVPSLLLFLGLGMLAGSDGPGGIALDDYELVQSLGVVALAFILFGGGLDTSWEDVRPVLWHGMTLATVGVVATAVTVGLFATVVFDLSLTGGILLGAIISSTDAAAVFSVLRSRGVGLRGRLRPLLELESGSNDPMAVFLTVAMIELLTKPAVAVIDLVPVFVRQMTVGGLVGYALARVAVVAINRLRLEYEGLYPVLGIAVVLLVYGATAELGGSGFLAVYVAGLTMSSQQFLHKRSLLRFHDALAWLMQIVMFLALGLLVFPSDLPEVAVRALLMSGALILVARPLAVLLTLTALRFPIRDTALVSWVGLRGAVPIILATFPLVEGLPQSEVVFNTVFFITIASVLVQGTTIPVAARLLGVSAPAPPSTAHLAELIPDGTLTKDLVEMTLAGTARAAGRQIVDVGLPKGVLIVLLSREDDAIVPQGGNVLEPGDRLLILVDAEVAEDVRQILGAEPSAEGA